MSLSGTIAGPTAHEPPFFSDVHSLLQNIMGELSKMREHIDTSDAQHQQTCDKLRKDLDQECHESRECMNKFRYEFDELVHKRVETVVEGLEEMEQSQRFKDRHQQRQIDTLEQEVNKLVLYMGRVKQTWVRLRQNSEDSRRLVEERQRQEKAGVRRRSLLKETINSISRTKEEQDTYDLAEQMRIRLKGSAQFIRGEDWEHIFKEQDLDKSGQINFHEFRVMARATLKLQEPDRMLRVVFDSLDADGSGDISISELVEYVADPAERMRMRLKKAARETGNDWRKLVREHDLDNSGEISFSEFRRLVHNKLKLLDKDMHLAHVFTAIDEDHSGEVSIRELTAWVEGRR